MIFTTVLIPVAFGLFGLSFWLKGKVKLALIVGAGASVLAWVAIGFLKGWA